MITCFRYYLEPASPLKSINTPVQLQQKQPPSQSNGIAKISHQQVDNSLAVLKSIQLTPPAANNRHHHHRTHHVHNGNANGFSPTSDSQNNNNNNFFNQQSNLNGTSNGTSSSLQNGSVNSNDFIADFSKASIYNSNNSLNSTESGGHMNGKITNGTLLNGDLNANFADFENNKIYNAAGEKRRYFWISIKSFNLYERKTLELWKIENLIWRNVFKPFFAFRPLSSAHMDHTSRGILQDQ